MNDRLVDNHGLVNVSSNASQNFLVVGDFFDRETKWRGKGMTAKVFDRSWSSWFIRKCMNPRYRTIFQLMNLREKFLQKIAKIGSKFEKS